MKKPKLLLITLGMILSPFLFAEVTLPNIPSTTFPITNYGADTTSLDNSTAINAAISAANTAGGGTVVISDGTYLSGPITMKSNVNLCIDSTATLRMMPYGNGNGSPAGSYPNNGTTDHYNNFIYGQNLNNIEVSGYGTIEGDGGSGWWAAYKANSSIKRPCMIRFKACNTVLVTDLTLQNAPNVHVTLGQSGSARGSNGTISHIKVRAPSNSPNTDAIDTWYWDGINIEYCDLSEGDDNVAMDSYTTNITIKHCTFGSGHGLSCGSYTIGVHNVLADSCTFNGTTNGIRLKSNRTRGGQDSSFVYQNMTMNNVKYPIYITSWYDKEPYPASAQTAATITSTTPEWKNIYFKNITATNCTYGGLIYGLPEVYVQNVNFENVHISSSKSGLVTNFVSGLHFNCSSVTAGSGDAIIPYDADITGINTVTGASTNCTDGLVSVNTTKVALSAYPNPIVNNNLTIKFDENIKKVDLFSLTGMKLATYGNQNESTATFNLPENLQAGCYVVDVEGVSGKSSMLKIIKE